VVKTFVSADGISLAMAPTQPYIDRIGDSGVGIPTHMVMSPGLKVLGMPALVEAV
jgi:hypothetical protein